jgi:hypothetical protein
MLDEYKNMISHADMLAGFKESESKINYMGEMVDVIIITTPTNELGDAVEAIFHKGTETLVDMNVIHTCSCHGHDHQNII